MDAFYASEEKRDNPILKGKPFIFIMPEDAQEFLDKLPIEKI